MGLSGRDGTLLTSILKGLKVFSPEKILAIWQLFFFLYFPMNLSIVDFFLTLARNGTCKSASDSGIGIPNKTIVAAVSLVLQIQIAL